MAVIDPITLRRGEDKTLRFSITDPTVRTVVRSGGDGLDEVETTVACVSTDGFTSVGRFKIDNEIVQYTGKTSTTFTDCTRGVAQVHGGEYGATSHVEGAVIRQVPNVTGWTTEIDVRKTKSTVTAIIEKAGSVLSAEDGLLDIVLVPNDTNSQTPDHYVFGFRRTDTDFVTVLAEGVFILLQDISS